MQCNNSDGFFQFARPEAIFLAMSFASFFRMDLRRLILLLALFSSILTLVNGFYATYQVQRQQLMDATLASNLSYARKLAESVDVFLHSAQQQLAYSAKVMG